MKCIALATRFGDTPVEWLVLAFASTSWFKFFAHSQEEAIKKEITTFCNNLAPHTTAPFTKNGHFFYVKKLASDYCIIATDMELTAIQIIHLSQRLLQEKIALKEVAANLEKYSQDYKIEQVKDATEELRKELKEDIEKLLERGGKIEALVKDTEEIVAASQTFKYHAEELNSCWPKGLPCNIL